MSYELSEEARAALQVVLDAQRLALSASVSVAHVAAVLSQHNNPKPV